MERHKEPVIGGPETGQTCACSGSCNCDTNLKDAALQGTTTSTPNEKPPGVTSEIDKHQSESQPQRLKEQGEVSTTDENGIVPIDIDDSSDPPSPPVYVTGWRLYMLGTGVWISLFLSTLETTIVSTSLVSITDAIHGFAMRDWIVTAYLITYTGLCPF